MTLLRNLEKSNSLLGNLDRQLQKLTCRQKKKEKRGQYSGGEWGTGETWESQQQ